MIFDGKEAVSQPDFDVEETESEWKLFRRIILKQYKDSSPFNIDRKWRYCSRFSKSIYVSSYSGNIACNHSYSCTNIQQYEIDKNKTEKYSARTHKCP